MKIVEQNAARLELREEPWLVWLIGGLFVAAGTGVAVMSTERLFGAAFAVVGAGIILAFANTVTVIFDRGAGRFSRAITGLVRNSEVAHPLAAVVSVRVDASHSGDPSRAHRLSVALSSGTRVPLTPSFSSGKSDKERTAAVIREFLGLQQAPEIKLPGFRDMFALMSDPGAAGRLAEMHGGAVAGYEEILRRDPDGPAAVDARRQLGTALALQNKPREAREHLEAARDLAVRHGNRTMAAEIEEMLKRLK